VFSLRCDTGIVIHLLPSLVIHSWLKTYAIEVRFMIVQSLSNNDCTREPLIATICKVTAVTDSCSAYPCRFVTKW
jgi:hypothetical protein